MLEIGQPAPDFTLNGTDKAPHTLSELRGTPVLLVFYPFTFTGICEGELLVFGDANVKRDNLSIARTSIVLALSLFCHQISVTQKALQSTGFLLTVTHYALHCL